MIRKLGSMGHIITVCHGDLDVIVYKRKKVSLTSKAYEYYWAHKVSINILIRFYYPLLGYSIVPLCRFCVFIAIIYITFSIIIGDDIMMGEIFSKLSTIQIDKSFLLVDK